MIIYNITLKVAGSVVQEWRQWMEKEHLPDMMATGLFASYRLCRLLEQDEEEDVTFVVQYHCDSMENYQSYLQEHATEMRQKGLKKFGDRVLSFRTLMEILV